MGEVDKPFGCPQPGCGMSFTNEDRLTVHRRRHEMQLTVNGEHHTPSLVKHHGFIIDQTPTPTRFLRQCEEVGLFQEISLNPFDEQFRRASLLRSHHSITESIGGGGESLDTPRVLPPPADSDETISSTSRDDISTLTTTNPTLTTTSSHASYMPPNSTSTTCPGTLPSAKVVDMVEEEELELERGEVRAARSLSLNVSSAAAAAVEAGQLSGSVISTPTPVITAGPSVTQSLGAVEIGSVAASLKMGGSLPASTQQPAICAAPSGVPASPSATVLQLLLRLPNGQAIPVEIPATPVVSSAAQTGTTSSSTSVASMVASPPNSHDKSPQQSLAKMKLKQALASSSTAARPGCSKTSRANTADRIAEMTRSRNFSGTSSTEGEWDDDGTSGSCNSTKGERKRRHSSDNEDPIEKRKKFLERNRAAAIRCREKKKKWIENLSIKYDELGSINQKLQSEVSSLRSEVAVLKSMLLQHKDCPVTLAMQGDGSLDGMNGSCPPVALPPMLDPVPETALAHKPRIRSLSLPSIPSCESSPVDPLPVNLSCCVHAPPPASTIVTSASSTSSPSNKVSVGQPAFLTSGSPVNLTNTFITTSQHHHHHQQSPHSSATSITRNPQSGTIIKITPGPVPQGRASSPHPTQLLAQAVAPSPVTSGAHTGKMGKIMLGPPELLGTEVNPKTTTLMINGTPNVIMAAAAPMGHAATLSQPQLLNLTLQTPHSKASSTVLRKPN